MLIEGPADADPLLDWVLADGMVPPLAVLAYAPEEPKIAAFWPFAIFSPEWQAMVWARRARRRGRLLRPSRGDDAGLRNPRDEGRAGPADPSHDPLGTLAAAAGYDDAERWWEDLVEVRLDGSSPFPLLIEAMAELRSASRCTGQPSP